MKEALREMRILNALTNDIISAEITDEALYFIVSGLGDNQLRAVKSYSTSKDAWNKDWAAMPV